MVWSVFKQTPRRWIDGTIRCQLEDANLDDKPLYEALSYTWARSTELASTHDRQISRLDSDGSWLLLDGARLKARLNLYDGNLTYQHNRHQLHGVRDLGKMQRASVHLWVDEICVDQINVTVRNAQVNMMAQIYGSASAVIVWLGRAQHSHIETLARAYNIHQNPLFDGLTEWDLGANDTTEYLRQIGLLK